MGFIATVSATRARCRRVANATAHSLDSSRTNFTRIEHMARRWVTLNRKSYDRDFADALAQEVALWVMVRNHGNVPADPVLMGVAGSVAYGKPSKDFRARIRDELAGWSPEGFQPVISSGGIGVAVAEALGSPRLPPGYRVALQDRYRDGATPDSTKDKKRLSDAVERLAQIVMTTTAPFPTLDPSTGATGNDRTRVAAVNEACPYCHALSGQPCFDLSASGKGVIGVPDNINEGRHLSRKLADR